ncbi:MAG TPA: GTP cyclohydrolase I FolE [Limnochordales bacterium]|nr:GTP cyclohydrolase I FolE [Limnochordales bacterium]
MAQHIETHVPPVDTAKIEAAVRMILEAIGEDPQREGLIDTPRRVAAAYAELCAGMRDDVQRHLQVHFQEDHDELVLVRDIPFFSLCEHHLLPFFGKAHIAYIPRDGRVTGLSKLARVVEAFARRLQMQERMTAQIADTLMEHLKPLGVAVVIEAEHLCMSMRGIQKPGAKTVTSAVRGLCRTDEKTRAEVMALIRGHGIAV